MILDKAENYFLDKGQEYLAKLYRAMIVTAYYGLFRIGEIAESRHVIKYMDVHATQGKDQVLFVLMTSKNHGLSNRSQVDNQID